MSDNTVQFEKITMLKKNFDILYENDPNVFVAGDLLWYPVEGHSRIRQAPDVMIAFGAKKGDRGSYRQWEEQGVAPQVAFEVISPGNRADEMENKRSFYQRYGVEEYYEYDPQKGTLKGWLNRGGIFQEIASMMGWESPLLGVSFEMEGKELQVYNPDGTPFLAHEESDRARRINKQAQLEAEERTREETQARIEAEERVREEEQARIEAEERARGEEQARIAEEQARIEAEGRARGEEQARIAETQARIEAEERIKEGELARIAAEARVLEMEAYLREMEAKLKAMGEANLDENNLR